MLIDYEELYTDCYLDGYVGGAPNTRLIIQDKCQEWFEQYKITKEDPILISSCGTGRFLDFLIEKGYKAQGTEICDCLLENQLKDKPVTKCFISDLKTFGENKFKFATACDILEHLGTVREVDEAIENLLYVSSKYVFVSMGQARGRHNKHILHNIRKSGAWWNETFSKFGNIIDSGPFYPKKEKGCWIFGEKK